MKDRVKTRRALRVTFTDTPKPRTLTDEERLKMPIKESFRKGLYLRYLNKFIERGSIKEPGVYDIFVEWTWWKPRYVRSWFERME